MREEITSTMEPELNLDSLRAIRVLGRGAMGTVFLVTDGSGRPPFALKVFDKRSPAAARSGADRRARWELAVLRRLRHPFLPSLLGSAETPDLLAVALPFCPFGDLHALRHSLPDRTLSPSALRFYLAELVSALSHLHALRIVYRDLKPENVLLRSSGHLLLTDFDLSRHLSPNPRPDLPNHQMRPCHPPNLSRFLNKAKSTRVSPVKLRTGERSHSFVGTEEYVSPEVVRGEGHEFAVDWWALGVLAYEMAYGRTPFRGRDRKETFRNVLMRRPEFLGRQPRELTDLIGRLLEKDPVKRLGSKVGAAEVRAHPFFAGVRWELLADVARPPFLASLEEVEEAEAVDGDCGFDVREYLKQQAVPPPPSSPASSSASLTEF